MDLMKWLNSLGDVLYEVMSWLIFYPVTFWRTVTNPLAMMAYSDLELHDSTEEQYDDTLNPPLFLVLSLLLAQGVDVTLRGGTNPIIADTSGLAGYISDNTTLLALRVILFSLFPLAMATRLLRTKGIKITRKRLKPAFYAQCYACAPFALFLGLGLSVIHMPVPGASAVGGALAGGSLIAYLTAETLWFAHHLHQGIVRAAWCAIRSFCEGAAAAIGIALLFVLH